MNKQQLEKIWQIEQLIQETKASLKTWSSQITQHYRILKELSRQVKTIKSELNMTKNNNPNTQSTTSKKTIPK
jgi:archaellum component FlaC